MTEMPPYTFSGKLEEYQTRINALLPSAFCNENEVIDTTIEAALYSLLAGGKRIRPVLMFAISDMLTLPIESIIPFACAIEMIHTYSLIHDDLPCMDNDDTRRGLPTCHVQYSEPIALLAGDALLNRAYETMLTVCLDGDVRKVQAALFLADMAGFKGMIGGQTLDLLSEGKKISQDQLFELHRKKTGCLFLAAALIPAILHSFCENNRLLYDQMTKYAQHIGLGFQIKDDLLDVTSTKEVLGKSIGKDAADEKSTFVTMYGFENAENLLQKEMDGAQSVLALLKENGYDTSFLEDLSTYLLVRNK
jgi:geranylgeranyl diphosphate synthase type II